MLQRIQPALPVTTVRFLAMLRETQPPCGSCKCRQFLSTVPLLVSLVRKISGNIPQSQFIMVQIERCGQVDAGGTEFQVDPVVDGCLQILEVVRAHLQGGHSRHGKWA